MPGALGADAGPCPKCHRSLLDLRASLSVGQLRGSKPLCTVPNCPLVQRVQGFRQTWEVTGREILGPSPPSVFVGRFGYPKVSVGPLLPPSYTADSAQLDDPRSFLGKDILGVLGLRSNLVRSKATADVRRGLEATGSLDVSRELAMAAKPVDTEVTLRKMPRLDMSPRLDQHAAPMGPSVTAERARITSNPSVPRKVDHIVSDTDAKAAVGARELYGGGIPVHHIQRILSVGLLGEAPRRRLVPTRWSITATDDMLGKALIEKVAERQLVGATEHYQFTHFGNRFHVLLIPRVWSFEMVEAWQQDPQSWVVIQDDETHKGRTKYADKVTGAYYAARLSVLEHLEARRRQAAALVYREITDAYFAPLGVWVIREGVRLALESKPAVYSARGEAVDAVRRAAAVKDWHRRSKLLERLATQTTLFEFG